MAADVDAVAPVIEGLGNAADGIGHLENNGVDIGALAEFVCGRQSCRPRTGDYRYLLLRQLYHRLVGWGVYFEWYGVSSPSLPCRCCLHPRVRSQEARRFPVPELRRGDRNGS